MSEAAMRKLQVRVKPNSRVAALEDLGGGRWLARVQSPPVDGKANAELIALIARHFGLRRAQVVIKRGASGPAKWVEIDE